MTFTGNCHQNRDIPMTQNAVFPRFLDDKESAERVLRITQKEKALHGAARDVLLLQGSFLCYLLSDYEDGAFCLDDVNEACPKTTVSYSYSTVAGGFGVKSYRTRLMPGTSVMIRWTR